MLPSDAFGTPNLTHLRSPDGVTIKGPYEFLPFLWKVARQIFLLIMYLTESCHNFPSKSSHHYIASFQPLVCGARRSNMYPLSLSQIEH